MPQMTLSPGWCAVLVVSGRSGPALRTESLPTGALPQTGLPHAMGAGLQEAGRGSRC